MAYFTLDFELLMDDQSHFDLESGDQPLPHLSDEDLDSIISDSKEFINHKETVEKPVSYLKRPTTIIPDYRRRAISKYLEKRTRRNYNRPSYYASRQKYANSRPRFKGRFLPKD